MMTDGKEKTSCMNGRSTDTNLKLHFEMDQFCYNNFEVFNDTEFLNL